jgi:3-oxoacyl-(acyl-carrier-protein) synthase/acyl carrier protein
VEVGPKKALTGFTDEVVGPEAATLSLFTCHPKVGEVTSFNQAVCGLLAAGVALQRAPARTAEPGRIEAGPVLTPREDGAGGPTPLAAQRDVGGDISDWQVDEAPMGNNYFNSAPAGSVVISGTGLGLPGAEKHVMDPDNARRILRGEQFVDLLPERFRAQMLAKRVTRLVKGDDGSGHFETIDDTAEVVKLAGRPGAFDLAEEYGVPPKLVEALDITSQLAMAAGLDALREAGLPLVQTYRRATTGKYLPDRWLLPEPLRDETGVIFASAFPGGDRLADEFRRYYTWQNRLDQARLLEDVRTHVDEPAALAELDRRLAQLREDLAREPYVFDRRFLFRVLAMGHSQFAEYIGARGPNTQVNAACASTTQAIALAEDWIRLGRCRRVVVIAADDVTGDNLMAWVGAGFLATGAVATDDRVDTAALPFDQRRHGTLMGMGACALVVESEDAVRERGMRALVELLSTTIDNSAFHGTRLDVGHIAQVMDRVMTSAERRFGVQRHALAPQLVFMSHETFTPARGGSAAAEIAALRHTFGDAAGEVVIANTKGFTGHPMGVGIEDVIAVKILEHGMVPPVPNYKVLDPELGQLNLSRGGRYPVRYALHLAAGFGSQIAMTLTRRVPGGPDRVDRPAVNRRWLADVTGDDAPATEVVRRVLRVVAGGRPGRPPVPSRWEPGLAPALRAAVYGGEAPAEPARPARRGETPIETMPAGGGAEQRRAEPTAPAAPPRFSAADKGPEMLIGGSPALSPAVAPSGNGHARGVTTGAAAGAAPAAAATAPAPPARSAGAVADQVLAIVADKTGYPVDMLELDLDLEADLGIDTVKQAETFAAIREAFDIPRRDDLKLRDYPTLKHVIGFVATALRGEPTAAMAPPVAEPAPAEVVPTPPSKTEARAAETDAAGRVLAIVADKTGYPVDMLELDLDLEADLGIDTVKQAETFAAIREAFDIPRRDDLKLRDYPTLKHVIGFVETALRAKDGGPGKASG